MTLLGGGAFGNRIGWILDALDRAISLFEQAALDVAIVSYGRSDADVQQFLKSR